MFVNFSVKCDLLKLWFFPPDVVQSRSAEIGSFTVIGNGTRIGNNTKISNSVVGEGCTIGSNVSIEGSYIWDNVIIEDGCKLMHSIVCDGVVIKSGAVLEPGVVLSFKVCVSIPLLLLLFELPNLILSQFFKLLDCFLQATELNIVSSLVYIFSVSFQNSFFQIIIERYIITLLIVMVLACFIGYI